jgi:hypothetical protein
MHGPKSSSAATSSPDSALEAKGQVCMSLTTVAGLGHTRLQACSELVVVLSVRGIKFDDFPPHTSKLKNRLSKSPNYAAATLD